MADFEESTRKTKSKSGKGKGAEKDSAKDNKEVAIIQEEEDAIEGLQTHSYSLIIYPSSYLLHSYRSCTRKLQQRYHWRDDRLFQAHR